MGRDRTCDAKADEDQDLRVAQRDLEHAVTHHEEEGLRGDEHQMEGERSSWKGGHGEIGEITGDR